MRHGRSTRVIAAADGRYDHQSRLVIKTFSNAVLVGVDEVGLRRESTGRLAVLLFQLVEVLDQPFSATGVFFWVRRVDDRNRKHDRWARPPFDGLRRVAGLPLHVAAERLGVSRSTVKRWRRQIRSS